MMGETLTRKQANRRRGIVMGLAGPMLVMSSLLCPQSTGAQSTGAQSTGAQSTGAQSTGTQRVRLSAVEAPGGDTPGETLRTQLARREAAALERHIATLHRKLHITAAQEPLWQQLAAAMRGNVAQLDRVYADRARQFGSMSAVDDLKSYATVQQTHARNVEALIPPFQNLYASFSASQKQEADETFRTFTENAVNNTR